MKTHATPRRRISAIMLSCVLALQANAQITVNDMDEDPGLSAQDLAEALEGSGVSIVANSAQLIQVVNPNDTPDMPPLAAAGTFVAANDVLGPGLENGIILSSGRADNIEGEENLVTGLYNTSSGIQASAGLEGDAQLEQPPGDTTPTYDATALEFDFVPDSSEVSIQFVFASDEYNEWVDRAYNDTFAIFLNGQSVNLATVKPNDDPVSINSINFHANSLLYRNNDNHTTYTPFVSAVATEADGLTIILTCTFEVDSGVENSLKLVIADRADSILDSWVLLKNASLTTVKPVVVTKEAELPIAVVENEYMNYSIHLTNTGPDDATIDAVYDLLPPGFQYQSGCTTGFTYDDPTSTSVPQAVGPGRESLVWTGPFTVPGNSTITLTFPAHVGSALGTFYNGATATGNVPIIASGDVAPVQTLVLYELAVDAPGDQNIPFDGTFDFGQTYHRSQAPWVTFTIRNSGYAELTGIALSLSYDGLYNFELDTTGTATSLAHGDTTTFKVRFQNYHYEVLTGEVFVDCNELTGTPFEFNLQAQSVTSLDIIQDAYAKASNTGAGDHFGAAIAVSGDTMVVGSPLEDSSATGVNGSQSNNSSTDSGAVYVYRRNSTTGLWSQEAYLKASNTGSDDRFGCSVAIDGNTLVVGAMNEDSNATGVNGTQANNSASNSGAVYVFTRSGSTWTQHSYLKASNTGAGDLFGSSVSIQQNTILVGAPNEDSNATGVNGNGANNSSADSGAGYVYFFSASAWNFQTYFKSSATAAGQHFGMSAAMWGDTAAFGAPDATSGTGYVGIYSRSASTWSHQQNVTAFNSEAGDFFGWSLALRGSTTSQASSLLVGAPWESSNGTGVGSAGSNNSNPDSGAAYLYALQSGTWNHHAFFKSAASNTQPINFGWAVGLAADIVVVSAPRENSSSTGIDGDPEDTWASQSGAVYSFTRGGPIWNWVLDSYIKASDTEASDSFGWSVGISGDILGVGGPGEDSDATGIGGYEYSASASASGAAYFFDLFD